MNGSAAGGLWTGDFTSALEESAYDNKAEQLYEVIVQLSEVGTSFIILVLICGTVGFIFRRREYEFNRLWPSRALFCCTCFIWVASFVLRARRLIELTPAQQDALCDSQIVLGQGVGEPGFALQLVLMYRSETLSRTSRTAKVNRAIIGTASLLVVPLAAAQAAILQYVLLRDVWAARTLARLKIDALSQPVDPPGMEPPCQIPTLALVVSAAFTLLCTVAYNVYSLRVASFAINRSQRRRLRSLRIIFSILLPLQVLLRVALASLELRRLYYEIVHFMYFVSVALLAALSIYNVAIRPVYDGALSGYKSSELPMDESADWSFRPTPEGHDANSSPLVDITAIV